MPVDPRTGRLLPYGPNPFLYQQLARTFTGQTAPEPPAGNPLRTRVVRRLRPDLLTGTRGGSMTLADVLRSATGLGSQVFGGGGGLADVLRSRQQALPEPVPSPTVPPVDVAPQPGAEDFLADLPMIPSLQNEPQVIARQLAAEVEAGKMSMAEAVARYRALRFGGR